MALRVRRRWGQAAWRRVGWRRPTAGQLGDRNGDRGDQHHGGTAAGADELRTVGAVTVDAGRHLERCHALTDVAVQLAVRHGRLLSNQATRPRMRQRRTDGIG